MANNDQSPTMNGTTSNHESPKNHHDPEAERTTSSTSMSTSMSTRRTPVVVSHEMKQWSFYRAVIAEFVATLLFLYISLTALVGTVRIGAGGVGVLETAWAFGGMIFILVYCTAGLSGGHINPAVTFGLLVARKVTIPRALAYVAAQCCGAMVGAAIAKGVHGSDEYVDFGKNAVNGVQSGHTVPQALGAEIMGTFVLLFTVLSATDPERNARDSHVPVLAPLPIGFAVFVVHIATIPITGTGINPARSLGAAVANPLHGRWNQHWIFWVGPMVGAASAALYHSNVMHAGSTKFRSNYV